MEQLLYAVIGDLTDLSGPLSPKKGALVSIWRRISLWSTPRSSLASAAPNCGTVAQSGAGHRKTEDRVMRANPRRVKFLILLCMWSLAITLFTTRLFAQEDGWQIIRAEYGFRNQRNDVTDMLRDLIGRGGVNGQVAVNNQTMGGDPAVGKDKNLHILARNRQGEQREFDFREGSFIDISLFTIPRDDWDNHDRDRGRDRDDRDRGESRGVFIIRGYYGIQGRMANVTDLLRSRVRDGGLSLFVNNQNLGGDPAVGAEKILIVVYRFRGEETATAIGEGNRLTIP